MKKSICTACFLIGILFPVLLLAQTTPGEVYTPQSWTQEYVELNRTGMLTLGSWAVLNFAVSIPGWFLTDKDSTWHNVHEMNVAWNLVNITLAGFGYMGLGDELASPPASAIAALGLSTDMQKILLFNAGLDVAYMTAGTMMLWLGDAEKKRLRGYGASLIAQGAFLFVFDLVLWWFNQSHAAPLVTMGFTPEAAQLQLGFVF